MPFSKSSALFQAVKYGPLQHDYEEAKVVIGPIISEPPPLDQFQKLSVEYRLNAIEGSIKEEEIVCPRVNVTENSSDHGTSVNGIYKISNDKVSWCKIFCFRAAKSYQKVIKN